MNSLSLTQAKNTPHRRARKNDLSHRPGDAVPPRIVQFGERGGEFAADVADLNRGNAHELGAFHHFHSIEAKLVHPASKYRKSSSDRPCENFSSPSTSSASDFFCFCNARIFSSMLSLISNR